MSHSSSSISVTYNDQTHRFRIEDSFSYSEVCFRINIIFPSLYHTPYFVGYFDDEQEFIRITSDLEIKEALSLINDENTLRLYITTSLENLPKAKIEVQANTNNTPPPVQTNSNNTNTNANTPPKQPQSQSPPSTTLTNLTTQEVLPKLLSTLIDGTKAVTDFMTNFLVPVLTPLQKSYDNEVNQLFACGFEDREKNLLLLKRFGGDVSATLDELLKA